MKVWICFITMILALLVSCENVSTKKIDDGGYEDSEKTACIEVDAPEEISERAFRFAELYEEADTEYKLGGQDPVRSILIDCSGLIIMCYKYALVDTKYQLPVSDMSANYMYKNASTHIEQSDLKKGNLLFMGESSSTEVTHIALFEKNEGGRIYFIDSTQKDTDGDGVNDIDGVTRRDYPEGDVRFKGFGRMRLKY